MHATDPDYGENKRIVYNFVGGRDEGHFKMVDDELGGMMQEYTKETNPNQLVGHKNTGG